MIPLALPPELAELYTYGLGGFIVIYALFRNRLRKCLADATKGGISNSELRQVAEIVGKALIGSPGITAVFFIAVLLLGSNGLGGNNLLNVNGWLNWVFIIVTALSAAYAGVEWVHTALSALPEILEPEGDRTAIENTDT